MVALIGVVTKCLQCGIQFRKQQLNQPICMGCNQALGAMPEIHQAFMARMARRIGDLEMLVEAQDKVIDQLEKGTFPGKPLVKTSEKRGK
jgi:hypothetical protein